MTSKFIHYQRGFASRVFDVFGTSGFNVSEDGRLGWYGPDSSWLANPGDWIYMDENGFPAVSRDEPVTSPQIVLSPLEQARAILEARIEILTNEAMATSAIEGIRLDRKVVRQAVLRSLAASFEQGGDHEPHG